ncbi:hypothetical protein L3Q82_010277, partial [Scortum barcoo]
MALQLHTVSKSMHFFSRCHLLDLPWEDVLVSHILCYLPLQHLVSLQRVSKQFHSLIQVYLANCRTFDLSLIGPSIPKEAFCSMLKDNKVLHRLSLHNCSDWVTDKELLPVIGQNQHLQRVDMSGCACLTRHSLVAVSLSCMHLQSLGLAHCEWVDSLSLRSLADHCGGLQSIDLTACRQLKDDAICYLAKKCVKLRSLSLAVNANVTDESVEEVAKNCRGLEQLDLTGCLRVRDQSIRYIISYFQDSCRVLPEAAVPEGESLSQCDRGEPGTPKETQCCDRRGADYAEGSGASSGHTGVSTRYPPPDIAKGPKSH